MLDVTTPPESKLAPVTLGRSPAVRAAAQRALMARDRLLADYPLWEEWRRQARALKTEALARLDEFLEELEAAVTAWGGRVLRARDAAEANRLILQVAREHEVREVVKSKSMTTEEIGLNSALAAAGIRTLETDLGEFIVQLAGHPPAHLTAPALHLNRRQIAGIFAEHLGLRIPPEPESLARQATAYINPHFFTAQMGITGVNCATPDGTLVLLENESNLRFTATLPKVHLAVMGLEKIIPRLTDAEVILRLLPASATGQRLTALVHFIRGLKPQPGGTQAFYLVILDNGRRRLAADPEMVEALYCLRCGACLNICPIFQVGAAHLYGRVYPGAIGILLAPYLAPTGDISDLCTQCGACQEICPAGLRLTEKIRALRRHSPRFRQLRLLSAAAGLVLSRPRWYRGLEPAWRPLARQGGLPGFAALAPVNFHRQAQGRPSHGSGGEYRPSPLLASRETESPTFPGEKAPSHAPREPVSPATQLATLLQEASASLEQVRGPAALARHLSAAPPPLGLEDHPWLRQVAVELDKLGIRHCLVTDDWAPELGTAVTVALGAIPETGSILVDSGRGPASVLPFRAQRHVLLVPPNRADLSLTQALALVHSRGPGLVSWLTGPSRTADIEKVLVLGAQGPMSMEMILYQEED